MLGAGAGEGAALARAPGAAELRAEPWVASAPTASGARATEGTAGCSWRVPGRRTAAAAAAAASGSGDDERTPPGRPPRRPAAGSSAAAARARTRSRSSAGATGGALAQLGEQVRLRHRVPPRASSAPGSGASCSSSARCRACPPPWPASRSSTTRSAITSRSPAAQASERRLELGREPFDERLLVAVGNGGQLLATAPAALGAEVVERDRPRHLAEPGPRRAACRVEPVPEPQRALERLGGEVLGGEPVAGEPRRGSRRRRPGGARRPARRSSHPLYAAAHADVTRFVRRLGRARGFVQRAWSSRSLRSSSSFGPVARARHLEVGAELLERRMGEERAEALADLALEDVRVAVAVRAERGRAVVHVQRAQAVEPDRLVDLVDQRRRRPPGRSRRSPRRRGGTSRGRSRAAGGGRARRRASPARRSSGRSCAPVAGGVLHQSHVSPSQRSRTCSSAATTRLRARRRSRRRGASRRGR